MAKRLAKRTWLLVLIFAVAIFIRSYKIAEIPTGFHRDEALVSWDAYSILKTARDQHGRFLPLSFEGFGISDYPLAVYLRVPIIALFGLNVASARLIMVVFSMVVLFFIYKLTQRFFDETTAVVAAFVATFSSWHFFMSRAGFATFHALMFFVVGIYLLLYGRGKWWKVAGGLAMGLTCFTYAAYYFFLPVFLVIFAAIYNRELKRDRFLKWGFAAAVITTAAAFVIFWNHNLRRAPQAAFYNYDRGFILEWTDKPVGELIGLGQKYDLFHKFLYRPQWAYAYKVALNYFESFSPIFWLKTGRGYESNVESFGNLLWWEPVLIIIGAGSLLWKRSKVGLLLILWILAGPAATAFTKDLSSTRLFHMVAPIIILEAVGFKYVWELLTNFKKRFVGYALLASFLLPIVFVEVLYFDSYFRYMSAYSGKWWFAGARETVDLLNKYPDKTAYIAPKGDWFYIFILFFNKYDPGVFQQEVKRGVTPGNLYVVSSFGRYNFVDQIKAEDVCRDFESIYVEKRPSGQQPLFVPDGQITSLGADTYYYFIPTSEKCESI